MDLHRSRTDAPQQAPRPSSLADLFFTLAAIALQGFGGVLSIVQREIVDKRQWLTQKEFTEDWAVAQILPGGNVVNLSIILGNRYFGWRGVLAALSGMLLPPLVLLLGVFAVYNQYAQVPQVAGAVRGMGAAAAGLIAAVSIRMLSGLKGNPLPAAVKYGSIAIVFVAIGLLRLPLVYVVLGLGLTVMAYAWRMLAKLDEHQAQASKEQV